MAALFIVRTAAGTCGYDAYEPNADLLSATYLRTGANVDGVVCQEQAPQTDLDTFLVHAYDGCTVRAELLFAHAQGDLALKLSRADGTVLIDANSADDNELILTTLALGGLLVLQVRMDGAGSNSYRLLLELSCPSMPTCPQDDGYEQNDALAAATQLTLGHEAQAISCAQNNDYFVVSAGGGCTVTANVMFALADGDLGVQLLDPATSAVLAEGQSPGNNETVATTLAASGSVAIRVFPKNGASSVTYSVLTSVSCPPPPTCGSDPSEPNDLPEQAMALETGHEQMGIVCGQELDYNRVYGTAGCTIQASLSYWGGTGNLAITIEDTSGSLIDAVGTSGVALIQLTLPHSGHFYVRVDLPGAGPQDVASYSLLVTASCPAPSPCSGASQAYEPNDSVQSAPYLLSPSILQAQVCGIDVDLFAFPAASGCTVDATVRFLHQAGNVRLRLQTLTEIVAAESNGGGDTEVIHAVTPSSGMYFLRTDLVGPGSAAYVLEFAVSCPAFPSCQQDDQLGEDDTPQSAIPLTSGAEVLATSCLTDRDNYTVQAPADCSVYAALMFNQVQGDLDATLYGADAQGGTATWLGTSAGTQSNEYVWGVTPLAGPQRIQVFTKTGTAQAVYSLHTHVTCPSQLTCATDRDLEPNNSTGEAVRFPGPLVAQGIVCGGDLDTYAIHARAGCALTAVVSSYQAVGGHLALDLTDSAGSAVVSSVDASGTLTIQATACFERDLFLRVRASAGASQITYKVAGTLTCPPPSPPFSCNDGNVCTVDTCAATMGCTHAPVSGACDDSNVCTVGEACSAGMCTGGSPLACVDDGNPCTGDYCQPGVGCIHPPNGAPCNDGNPCTGSDLCSGSACQPGAPISCDDTNPCTTDACVNPGGCTYAPNTVPCNDGDPCTALDQCTGGGCQGAWGCEDGNECTDDTCVAGVGCDHLSNSAPCSDDNSCSVGEHCGEGSCGQGVALQCDDANPCTDDGCDPASGCTHVPNETPCDDGNACSVGDACQGGTCVASGQLSCPPGSECTPNACDPATGTCAPTPRPTGTPCDDSDLCTQISVCFGGQCVGGDPTTCPNPSACQAPGSCNPTTGACVYSAANDGAACTDGSACTEADTCASGACVGIPVSCEDGDPCSADVCDPATGCSSSPAEGVMVCDTACTVGGTCASGNCMGGTATLCDDGDVCTTDLCDDALGCVHDASSASCDDGNVCTSFDHCVQGICVGSPSACDDGDACTADSCSVGMGCQHVSVASSCSDSNECTLDYCESAAGCVFVQRDCSDGETCTDDSCNPASGCVHGYNSAPCWDGLTCTIGDACNPETGACAPGAPSDALCNDGNACTLDTCSGSTGCTHGLVEGGACDDGNICTTQDTCAGSSCVGGPPPGCDDGDVCTTDGCEPGVGCGHWPAGPVECDDGNACTIVDTCTYQGTCEGTLRACADGVACTEDLCDPALGCVFPGKPDGAWCDDGNPCTSPDSCSQGACGGAATSCADGTPCTTDSCDPALGCLHVPAPGVVCDDGNVCTDSDACQQDASCSGLVLACDDGNACTIDSCANPVGCQHSGTSLPCDDGSACTSGDQCNGAECTGAPVSCDDNVPCTADGCVAEAGCVYEPIHTACIDGDPCTTDSCDPASGCLHPFAPGVACDDQNVCTNSDTCQEDASCAGLPVACDDGNPCTIDSCANPVGCQHLGSGLPCDDGSACTSNDHCNGSACAGTAVSCDDGDLCTADGCVPESGCQHAASTAACGDSNPCTDDTCSANACKHAPNVALCDDVDACTTGDVCQGGACQGTYPAACNDGDPCTTDACAPALGCTHAPSTSVCEDGNACTGIDRCLGGTCSPGPSIDCDDHNPCTADTCTTTTGCSYQPVVGPCDDLLDCTSGDVCQGGACVGSGPPGCDILSPVWPPGVGLVAEEVGRASVLLRWTQASSDNVAVTKLRVAPVSGEFAPTRTTHRVTGLLPGTTYTFQVEAGDAAGNWGAGPQLTVTTSAELPPDPALVAPALDTSAPYVFGASMMFLFEGEDPVQYGVLPGTIDPERICVLRSHVLGHAAGGPVQPVPGVKVAIAGHAEYGFTFTREDGAFDLAVNGGGPVVLRFEAAGWLPIDRTIATSYDSLAFVPEVVLTAPSPASTAMTSDAATTQMHAAPASSDSRGTRRALVVVPPGARACIGAPCGQGSILPTFTVRATEYTVGERGEDAMPADLPPATAYTYAVEFSVDEAPTGSRVFFDPPVSAFVQVSKLSVGQPAFLEHAGQHALTAGMGVPVGFYDREDRGWEPMMNARVIEILGLDEGLAAVDVTGDGLADSESGGGLSIAERSALAGLGLTAGARLWWMRVDHFTPFDWNLYGSQANQMYPNLPPPYGDGVHDDPCHRSGSIIECEHRTLREDIPVAGTPFYLSYRSDRVLGRTSRNKIVVPLSGSEAPEGVKWIRLQVKVAGFHTELIFPPSANLEVPVYLPQPKDIYGRDALGVVVPYVTRIGYVYPFSYQPPNKDPGFGQKSQEGVTQIDTLTETVTFWVKREGPRPAGIWDARGAGLGAWTLSPHHIFAPYAKQIFLGDGEIRDARRPDGHIERILEGGGPKSVAVTSDGTLYVADCCRIRRLGTGGAFELVAGMSGGSPPLGGNPAEEVDLGNIDDFAVTDEGELFISHDPPATAPHILRIRPDHGVYIIAGGDVPNVLEIGDVELPCAKFLGGGVKLAVGWYGSLFFGPVGFTNAVYRQSAGFSTDCATGPVIGRFAGGCGGSCTGSPEGADSALVDLGSLTTALATGPDGSLYIATADTGTFKGRIRRVDTSIPSGPTVTVAGSACAPGTGCMPADETAEWTSAEKIRLNPTALAIGPNGSVFFGNNTPGLVNGQPNDMVWTADVPGALVRIAGASQCTPYSTEDPNQDPRSVCLHEIQDLAVAPDNTIYIADDTAVYRVRRHSAAMSLGMKPIPDSRNGLVYMVDKQGLHQETRDGTTGATLLTMQYTKYGNRKLITGIVDAYQNTTTIERAADGVPVAIHGPFGHTTSLTVSPDGYLTSIEDPIGARYEMEYSPSGLLTHLWEPNVSEGKLPENDHVFAYDAEGQLEKDEDPIGGSSEVTDWGKKSGTLKVGAFDTGWPILETWMTYTSAMGRPVKFAQKETRYGNTSDVAVRREMVTTGPDGLSTAAVREPSWHETLYPDGSSDDTWLDRDPLLGWAAPVPVKFVAFTPNNVWVSNTTDSKVSTPPPPALLTSRDPTLFPEVRTDRQCLDGDLPACASGKLYTTTYARSSSSITSTTPEGRESVATLDVNGRIIRVAGPGQPTSEVEFDSKGRLAEVRSLRTAPACTTDDDCDDATLCLLPLGQCARTTSFQYHPLTGDLTLAHDPLGHSTVFEHDDVGRVNKVSAPLGGEMVSTTFGYDLQDNLKSVLPPARPAHVFDYTKRGELERYWVPTGGMEKTSYDLDGAPTQQLTLGFTATTLSYHPVTGRLETIVAAGPNGSTAFIYDSVGRVSDVTGGQYDVHFEYDGGLVTSTTWTTPPGIFLPKVTYEYGTGFVLTGIDVTTQGGASHFHTSFEPDLDGLVVSATHATPGGVSIGILLGRDADTGAIDTVTVGAVTETLGYSGFGELSSIDVAKGAQPLYHADLARDALGRLVTRGDQILGEAATETHYGYDTLGRLESVISSAGPPNATYTYDPNGIRLSYTGPLGTLAAPGPMAFDPRDFLLEYGPWTFQPDNEGRREQRTLAGANPQQSTTYAYDAAGSLLQVTLPDGTEVGYSYDALGRRLAVSVDGAVKHRWIYHDDLHPIAEVGVTGSAVASYVYASRSSPPDVIVADGGTYRIIADQLGSVRLVVSAFGAEVVVRQRLDFDEFGRLLRRQEFDATGASLCGAALICPPEVEPFQPFGFAGGLADYRTGLVHFGAREYDPDTGRWLQPDPIGFAGGDTNVYAYVGNDPVNAVDPSGLSSRTDRALSDLGLGFAPDPCEPSFSAVGMGVLGAMGGLAAEWALSAVAGKAAGTLIERGIAKVASKWVGRFHRHHTVPKEILNKYLPKDVADAVRGRSGAPNRWRIPRELHKEIHRGPGGGAYNEAFKARLKDLGRTPTPEDVLQIRDDLVDQFGLGGYRP